MTALMARLGLGSRVDNVSYGQLPSVEMDHRTELPPPDDAVPDEPAGARSDGDPAVAVAAEVDDGPRDWRSSALSALPVAGVSRRRAALLLAGVVTIWVVSVFARQVGEASAATARADAVRAGNAALQVEVASLDAELALIGRPPYIEQQARGYGLGGHRERPFSIAPDAPPLGPDAPGSASVRLGSDAARESPLEVWLSILFGPGG